MIWLRPGSNLGRMIRMGPGPCGRPFLETSNFESWQLWSPLFYRLDFYSIKRSKSFKGFRSFNAKGLGSLGQRASKLPAFKVGGLKKKSAAQPQPHSNHTAYIRERPGSNHSQSLMADNFAALWLTDPKFSAFKDLNPFSIVYKVQEAGSILRVGFGLSKWPHFHRAYLSTVCKQS